MTRPTGEDAMSSEHVEVLERLRGVLEHGKMGDKCLIAPDLVTAAIASLSAQQPPAEAQACGCGEATCVEPWEPGCGLGKSEQHVEAQPVAWEWEYIGVDQYPRGHKVARSLREMNPTNPPYPETWRPTRPLIYGDTAPPSAPVGVEGHYHPCTSILIEGLKRLEGGSDVLEEWDRARVKVDTALAQQPAAVDGVVEPATAPDVARLVEAARNLRRRQRAYLEQPKGERDESKGRLVGDAARELDEALAPFTVSLTAEGEQPEGSRSVTNQLLHWGGIPVYVTGTVTTSPGNWSLIDAALSAQPGGRSDD